MEAVAVLCIVSRVDLTCFVFWFCLCIIMLENLSKGRRECGMSRYEESQCTPPPPPSLGSFHANITEMKCAQCTHIFISLVRGIRWIVCKRFWALKMAAWLLQAMLSYWLNRGGICIQVCRTSIYVVSEKCKGSRSEGKSSTRSAVVFEVFFLTWLDFFFFSFFSSYLLFSKIGRCRKDCDWKIYLC